MRYLPMQLLRSGMVFCLLALLSIHGFAGPNGKIVLSFSEAAETGVRFDHLPGLYESAFNLNITAGKGISFTYTTNGNLPGPAAPMLPSVFSISSTTALSLQLYRNNKATDSFFCGTYLINFKTTLPVTTLIVPPSLLTDPVTGIYSGGGSVDGKTRYGNCWKDIEVPAFFEYYTKKGKNGIAQYCGLEIFGGFTRANKEKSMKVIAKKKYGKSKFKYPVFKDKDIHKFNSLILRVSGSDYNATRFLDMLCSSLGRDMGIDYMAFEPSVLFVNGEYWGIHNIREKVDLNYLETNHDADSSKTDLLCDHIEVKVGNKKAYNALFKFLDSISPTHPRFIEETGKRMDIQNYFNYIILETHIINVDSRGNVKYWRAGNTDNKFRWILYDCDLSFASPNLNYLSKRLSPTQTDWYNPTYATFLLRKLTANPTLKNQFINQYCYLLSTHLSNDSIQNRISYFRNLLYPEMSRHVKRKGFNESVAGWENQVKRLRNFSEARKVTAMQHLQADFNLSKKYTLQLENNIENEDLNLIINGNKSPSNHFKGVFFKEAPLVISADTTHPLFRFTGWSDGVKNAQRTISNSGDTLVSIKANYEPVRRSSNYGSWKIQTVKPGGKKTNPWILIRKNELTDHQNILCSVNKKTKIVIRNSKDFNEIVIVGDSSLWRNSHITFKGKIIQQADLKINARRTLYMLADEEGRIVDSVSYERPEEKEENAAGFLQRNEDELIPSVKEDNSAAGSSGVKKKMAAIRFLFSQPIFLLLLTLAFIPFGILLFFLSRLIFSKKKSNKTD